MHMPLNKWIKGFYNLILKLLKLNGSVESNLNERKLTAGGGQHQTLHPNIEQSSGVLGWGSRSRVRATWCSKSPDSMYRVGND